VSGVQSLRTGQEAAITEVLDRFRAMPGADGAPPAKSPRIDRGDDDGDDDVDGGDAQDAGMDEDVWPTVSEPGAAATATEEPAAAAAPRAPSPRVDEELRRRMALARAQLPAFACRDAILAMVRSSQVSVLSGETGCGKTTQVPQFLLETAGDAPVTNIICTQPRRISAVSVAERVAQERGEPLGGSIGYQVPGANHEN
jgi:HrpA-like RNA helicase